MQERPQGSVKALLIILMLVAAVNAGLLAELGMYSRNTLERHSDWFLGKTLVERQPFGASECRVSRNLVARNRINLGAWYGSQELVLNRVLSPERIHFRFRLANLAYLAVYLRTADGFAGVRLSRNPEHPSVAFRADEGGGFVERQPLSVPAAEGPGWHVFDQQGNQLSIDGGAPVTLPPLAVNERGVLTLRGATDSAEVDDVQIWEGGRQIIDESFRNDNHQVEMANYSIGLVTLVTILAWALFRRRREPREALLYTLLTSLMLLATLFCLLVFDYVYWSQRHCYWETVESWRRRCTRIFRLADMYPMPPDTKAVRAFLNAPPEARVTKFKLQVYRGNTMELVKDDLESILAYRATHPAALHTVMFLGSSQTWGEGAYRSNQTAVARVAAALGDSWEVVNAAKQGTNAMELCGRYVTHLHNFQPRLVVINLSNNDNDVPSFSANLSNMVQFGQNRGIATLFVMEANNPENPPTNAPHLPLKHAAMKSVADGLRVPIINMDAFLRQPENIDSGFLWWDNVHPSSQGHKLAAQFLIDGIKKYYP